MTHDLDDDLTGDERRALAAWDVPGPPVGFAARTVARAADRTSPARVAMVAAAVLVIVGGLASAQFLSSRLPPTSVNEAPGDAGPAEVASRDGVRS